MTLKLRILSRSSGRSTIKQPQSTLPRLKIQGFPAIAGKRRLYWPKSMDAGPATGLNCTHISHQWDYQDTADMTCTAVKGINIPWQSPSWHRVDAHVFGYTAEARTECGRLVWKMETNANKRRPSRDTATQGEAFLFFSLDVEWCPYWCCIRFNSDVCTLRKISHHVHANYFFVFFFYCIRCLVKWQGVLNWKSDDASTKAGARHRARRLQTWLLREHRYDTTRIHESDEVCRSTVEQSTATDISQTALQTTQSGGSVIGGWPCDEIALEDVNGSELRSLSMCLPSLSTVTLAMTGHWAYHVKSYQILCQMHVKLCHISGKLLFIWGMACS